MPNDNLPTSSGFEGPEKLLEIWFSKPSADYIQQIKLNGLDSMTLQDSVATLDPSAPSASATKKEGLRLVDRSVWEEMLNIVQCRVLSALHNEYADAYLLSESSMFVHSYRLTLKTCGTTTLLHSIEKILEIAREHCQLDKIEAVFYSRKAFLFPEQQTFPHGSWSDEVF
jgi:S-adenosylmethionine decarboxylase